MAACFGVLAFYPLVQDHCRQRARQVLLVWARVYGLWPRVGSPLSIGGQLVVSRAMRQALNAWSCKRVGVHGRIVGRIACASKVAASAKIYRAARIGSMRWMETERSAPQTFAAGLRLIRDPLDVNPLAGCGPAQASEDQVSGRVTKLRDRHGGERLAIRRHPDRGIDLLRAHDSAPVCGLNLKNTLVTANRFGSIRSQAPCDAPRSAGAALALSTVPPSPSNVARTRPGGSPGSVRVTSQDPTSACAELCSRSFLAAPADIAPAATMTVSAISAIAPTIDVFLAIVPPVNLS